ncbi:hypothetical protein [Cupriavidus sp. D39]|uniref:hypothetical protein n=1 Tax=Cupriavidus sp. D39 TaxID=2997877 RepID=UPI00227183F9|nr:hypothetical protein [Cupriavidus sp. D39]MCY0853093.1 hypothetical protein [Cupriavidus sp. D39]
MNCWICGSPATSAEHLLKASDLRACFGAVSQDKPLYLHTDAARNVRKRTVKDPAFKSDALLCAPCNNALSQPYDRAWERLSAALRAHPSLFPGRLINLGKVFQGPAKDAMRHVHLYFVKVLGCRIVEHGIPIDIGPFAQALRAGTAHPHVHLAIGPAPAMPYRKRIAGWSEIQGDEEAGRCVFAASFYHVGDVAVNILYAEPGQRRFGLSQAWHPDSTGRLLRLANFDRA